MQRFLKNKILKVSKYMSTMELSTSLTSRGALIVFEGLDRSGKTTQSSLLVKYLTSINVPVKKIVFPDRKTHIGVIINAYLSNEKDLSDESIHLLFAANRWEVHNEMKKLLATGTTLVVDRYSYSGVAYSAAKGLSLDWCKGPERGLIRPDVVFYLTAGIDALSSRGNFGAERYEKMEFQKKIAQVFGEIFEAERKYWKKIDATKDIETIHQQISSETMKLLDNVKSTDINILWT